MRIAQVTYPASSGAVFSDRASFATADSASAVVARGVVGGLGGSCSGAWICWGRADGSVDVGGGNGGGAVGCVVAVVLGAACVSAADRSGALFACSDKGPGILGVHPPGASDRRLSKIP